MMSAHSNHILVFDQSINQKPQLWKNSRNIIQLSKIFYWSITVRCCVYTSPLLWISFPFRSWQSLEHNWSLCQGINIFLLLKIQAFLPSYHSLLNILGPHSLLLLQLSRKEKAMELRIRRPENQSCFGANQSVTLELLFHLFMLCSE